MRKNSCSLARNLFLNFINLSGQNFINKKILLLIFLCICSNFIIASSPETTKYFEIINEGFENIPTLNHEVKYSIKLKFLTDVDFVIFNFFTKSESGVEVQLPSKKIEINKNKIINYKWLPEFSLQENYEVHSKVILKDKNNYTLAVYTKQLYLENIGNKFNVREKNAKDYDRNFRYSKNLQNLSFVNKPKLNSSNKSENVNETTISVSGVVEYIDENDKTIPLSNTYVKIENYVAFNENGDPYPNPFYYQYRITKTDANGYYYVPDWGMRSTRVIVKIDNDAGFYINDAFFSEDWSLDGMYVTGNIENANIQIESENEIAHILNNLGIARDFTLNKFNWSRPRIAFEYNPGIGVSNFDPDEDKLNFYEQYSNSNPISETWGTRGKEVTSHEYGHSVMYNAFGNQMPPSDWSVSSHNAYTVSAPIFAFVEGWAEFFSAAVWPYEIGGMGRFNFEGNPYSGIPYYKGSGSNTDGRIVEGAVANYLWNIFDGVLTEEGVNGDNEDINDYTSNLWNTFKNGTYVQSSGEDYHHIRTVDEFRGIWNNICPYSNYYISTQAPGPRQIEPHYNKILFGTPEMPPAVPGSLAASLNGSTTVILNWLDQSDVSNKNNETGFKIERKVDSGNWEYLSSVNSNVTTATLSNQPAGNLYYRVYSYNQYNNSIYSNEANVNIPVQIPVISGFTQYPNPICPENNVGYVTCNLSEGNGSINYNWSYVSLPSGVVVTFNGNTATVTKYYSIAGLKNSDVKKSLNFENASNISSINVQNFTLYCYASNSAGSSNTMAFSPNITNKCPGDGGCPTLQFSINSNIIDENTLLVSSPNNPNEDVADYYLTSNPFLQFNSEINFKIYEPSNSTSYFDNFELIQASVHPEEEVAISEEGEIINYKEPKFANKVFLNKRKDISDVVFRNDNINSSIRAGSIIDVKDTNSYDEAYLVLKVIGPPQKIHIAGRIYVDNKEVGQFYGRNNFNTICKKISNPNKKEIKIKFEQDVNIDQIIIVKNLHTVITNSLELNSAIHNKTGEVKDTLKDINQSYVRLSPQENIDFKFNNIISHANKSFYILKTIGRYGDNIQNPNSKNLSNKNNKQHISFQNKLHGNYPNPFNPTTKIIFEIAEAGVVHFKIYDMIGREIETLVAEYMTPGQYEIEFNGKNLSSGMYFCKFFLQEKMIDFKRILLLK